jgi:hypothetical protein
MKKLERKKLIEDLHTIDNRLKFTNLLWDDEIKNAFNSSGSFDFINLVSTSPKRSIELVERFKLVR